MEDIVLLETLKAANDHHRVFKLQFVAGEFDMVIYDEKENSCEILRSSTAGSRRRSNTGTWWMKKSASKPERRFGPIRGRYALYRGEASQTENGVQYRNVESYLKELAELDMCQSNKIAPQPIGPVL